MSPETHEVLAGTRPWWVEESDCLAFLRGLPPDSLDLVFGSPPYEEARLYLEGGQDLGVSRKTGDWVEWMVEVYRAAQAACRGLVAFVVAGQTRKYRWSAGPALLMAELHRAGLNLRNPPVFARVGIPGSGGPDWLRSDYEWVVCTSRPGKLPWSDNTACGKPPKFQPGGAMSHRVGDGSRVNAKGHAPRGTANGDLASAKGYTPPALANPGTVIRCKVGGGQMGGDTYSSQNEAPFPEKLAEFFVRSFCPPGGLACDPYSGSGTTGAVSARWGRRFLGCDLRASQADLSRRRVGEETPFFEGMR